MRAFPLLIAFALASAGPAVFAQTEDHSAHHPSPGVQPESAQPDRPEAAQPAGLEHEAAKPDALQENMKSIESLMQQIQQATDPARKRELLSQHMQALQKQMRLVAGRRAPMKMSMKEEGKTDARGDGMMKDGGMMKGGGMMMHKKVEQRLEMIERLLQQVVEREAVEAEFEAH